MLYKLGKTDIKVAPIIMGCAQAGGVPFWQNIDDNVSIKAMRTALELGINMFDTAPMYGDGHSERILGAALKDVRHNAVIATKISPQDLHYQGVLDSCESSLKNLKTDYIDLLQVHLPAGTFGTALVSIEETLSAFDKLKNDGKIRAVGVSNFSVKQLEEAIEVTEIASVQPPYSLFWKHAADELTPFCIRNNISILAYAPLAQGLLTGRYTRENVFPDTELRSKQILCEPQHYERVQCALDALRPIANANLMTLSQLAINWLISQPQTFAIVGVRAEQQVHENVKSLNCKLSNDDLKRISEIGDTVTLPLQPEPLIWHLST
jgi:aryl-alcohol dehydrogenase-like predicted oxidoreductase